jgi:hypothetical protein
MSYFQYHNCELTETRGRILGSFKSKESNVLFEYAHNVEQGGFASEFPHKIALQNGTEFRYARVGETVAYIVVEEGKYGEPVCEKWQIKAHRKYA